MQIAEHEQFTAINALTIDCKKTSNMFRVNTGTPVVCKYAAKPNSNGEFPFTFTRDNMEKIESLIDREESLFIALVCFEAQEICCLTKEDFVKLIRYRKETLDSGVEEGQFVILATIEAKKSFRVFVNAAGSRGKIAGDELVVSRNDFPKVIFE